MFSKIVVVFALVFGIFGFAHADGTVGIMFQEPNVVSVSGVIDGQVSIDWGDGSSWDSPNPANQFSESHSYTYTAEPGGYEVTVTVTGAAELSETFLICWNECPGDDDDDDNGGGEDDDSDNEEPQGFTGPVTHCDLNNPADVIPTATEEVFWYVEGSGSLYGEPGKVSYIFNPQNHQDQINFGLPATSRRILNQDGEHVGDLWVVEYTHENSWWRCGMNLFGFGSFGRPMIAE